VDCWPRAKSAKAGLWMNWLRWAKTEISSSREDKSRVNPVFSYHGGSHVVARENKKNFNKINELREIL
jgi:hypothetical protein